MRPLVAAPRSRRIPDPSSAPYSPAPPPCRFRHPGTAARDFFTRTPHCKHASARTIAHSMCSARSRAAFHSSTPSTERRHRAKPSHVHSTMPGNPVVVSLSLRRSAFFIRTTRSPRTLVAHYSFKRRCRISSFTRMRYIGACGMWREKGAKRWRGVACGSSSKPPDRSSTRSAMHGPPPGNGVACGLIAVNCAHSKTHTRTISSNPSATGASRSTERQAGFAVPARNPVGKPRLARRRALAAAYGSREQTPRAAAG